MCRMRAPAHWTHSRPRYNERRGRCAGWAARGAVKRSRPPSLLVHRTRRSPPALSRVRLLAAPSACARGRAHGAPMRARRSGRMSGGHEGRKRARARAQFLRIKGPVGVFGRRRRLLTCDAPRYRGFGFWPAPSACARGRAHGAPMRARRSGRTSRGHDGGMRAQALAPDPLRMARSECVWSSSEGFNVRRDARAIEGSALVAPSACVLSVVLMARPCARSSGRTSRGHDGRGGRAGTSPRSFADKRPAGMCLVVVGAFSNGAPRSPRYRGFSFW